MSDERATVRPLTGLCRLLDDRTAPVEREEDDPLRMARDPARLGEGRQGLFLRVEDERAAIPTVRPVAATM